MPNFCQHVIVFTRNVLANNLTNFDPPLKKYQNRTDLIIQSEHEKNRWNDVWRTNQVERTTANPFHVFSHFSTGTRQTLTVEKGAERSLRYELFQFYR